MRRGKVLHVEVRLLGQPIGVPDLRCPCCSVSPESSSMTLAFYVNHPDHGLRRDGADHCVSVVLLVFEETMPIEKGSWIIPEPATRSPWHLRGGARRVRFVGRQEEGAVLPEVLAGSAGAAPAAAGRCGSSDSSACLRLFRLFQLGLLLDRRVSVLRGVLRVNFYFLWILVVLTDHPGRSGSAVMAFLSSSTASATEFDGPVKTTCGGRRTRSSRASRSAATCRRRATVARCSWRR